MSDHETAAGVGEREPLMKRSLDAANAEIDARTRTSTPAASTDPAPDDAVREAVHNVTSVADWPRPSVDLHAIGRWSMAMDVRAALAAHPAPETPEQVPTSDAGGALTEAVDRVQRFLDERERPTPFAPKGFLPVDFLGEVTRTGDRLMVSDLRALIAAARTKTEG